MAGARGACRAMPDHSATLTIGDFYKRPLQVSRYLRPAIARIAPPLDRRTLGRLPVQPQWIGKRPRSELQKEQLLLRRRTHSCAFLSTFPDPPVAMYR